MEIKDLKPRDRIWFEPHGEDEVYTVFGNPYIEQDGWMVSVTDDGDYCWHFSETDEPRLHYAPTTPTIVIVREGE